MNLQLRFSPAMLALRALLERGALGSIVDVDLRLVTDQPWHLWTFMIGRAAPRARLPFDPLSRRHQVDRR